MGDVLSQPTQPHRAALNPNALMVVDAAKLLSAAGGQIVTVEMIETDLAAGAPMNGDGTVNFIHYAAWLVKEMAGRDD